MPPRPSLRLLARQLRVSVSTVSKALQNHPSIGLRTRERVQELARQLDYQPNPLGQNLRRQQTRTVGVLLPDVTVHFYSVLVTGMEEAARARDYRVVFCPSGEESGREAEQLQNLERFNVDGLLATPARTTSNFAAFERLRARAQPLLLVSRVPEGFAGVASDDRQGAYDLTERLIQLGYRRLAGVVGPGHLTNFVRRGRGFRQALFEHGMGEGPVLETDLSPVCNRLVFEALLNETPPPEVVCCPTDLVALEFMRFLREKNLEPGRDVAVTGFGNQFLSEVVEPSLTTVDQQPHRIGVLAMNLLLDAIERKMPPPEVVLNVETKPLLRASTPPR